MQDEGPEGIVIRRATGADGAPVRELVFGVLAEYGLAPDPGDTDADLFDLEAAYFAAGGHFEVAADAQGRIVGCFGLRPLANGAVELRKMYLRREARGRGLGRRLLARAIALARAGGWPRLELETASVLKEAISLYEKTGFRPRPGKPDTCRCDRAYVLDLG